MKLIDLLVQELPKRGGWPEGAESVVQDADDSEFYFFTGGPVKNGGESWWLVDSDNRNDNSKWIFFEGKNDIADDCNSAIVTRDQYESALALSRKPAWNGEGLPPVGCECEARLRCSDGEWFFFRCVGVDCGVAFGWAGKEAVTLGKGSYEFRPLRTEADRKREVAIEAILSDMRTIPCDLSLRDEVAVIYDAIAAGKIPGVKLDD